MKDNHYVLLVLVIIGLAFLIRPEITGEAKLYGRAGIPECDDKIDNDNDGFIDMEDLDCDNPYDNSEFKNIISECNDGVDNDNDGMIDMADSNCKNWYDLKE